MQLLDASDCFMERMRDVPDSNDLNRLNEDETGYLLFQITNSNNINLKFE